MLEIKLYILLPIAIGLFFGWLAWFLDKNILSLRRKKEGQKIPGEFGSFFLGKTKELGADYQQYFTGDFFQRCLARYGYTWKMGLLGLPTVFVSRKEDVLSVLNSEFNGVEVAYPPSVAHVLGTKALLMLPKAKHRIVRNLVMRALSTSAVASFVPEIEKVVRRTLADWAKEDRVVFGHEAHLLTFDIGQKVILGLDLDRDAMKAASRLFDDFRGGLVAIFPINLPFIETKFSRAMRARGKLLAMLDAKYDAMEREAQDQGSKPSTNPSAFQQLLSLAREDKADAPSEFVMDKAEIVEQTLFLLFAAHDTSASSLAVALYCLSTHPEAFRRLREEQDRIVARHGPAITADILTEMTYAEAVVRETLRIRPVAAGLLRRTTRPFTLSDGLVVPEGWLVQVSVRAAHYTDPKFGGLDQLKENLAAGRVATPWMDFQTGFNPDFWLEEDGRKKPQAWFGFGGGPRLCAGQALAMAEMKVILGLLAREWDFQLLDKDPNLTRQAFPSFVSGLPIKVVPRKKVDAASDR